MNINEFNFYYFISLPEVLLNLKLGILPGLPVGSYLNTITLPSPLRFIISILAILNGSCVEPKHCKVNYWKGDLSKIVISCLSRYLCLALSNLVIIDI